MITFNQPCMTGNESQYVLDAMRRDKLSGDGFYGQKCAAWLQQALNCVKVCLTPSCTHALEMAAMLVDIQPGDEVIMPSFTFVSTANAFVLRGARVIFVDIRPDTLNLDEELLEAAITPRTKAIVPVHYAGVGCEMERIMALAEQYDLFVIEDAAQGMMSHYRQRPLGTLGHLGAFSFHETKNFTSGGEGGCLIVNDSRFVERAEILREKGTNRSQFFRGMVDKYSWVDIGSSYLPSELQSAYLWGQLERVDQILQDRLRSWHHYFEGLKPLAATGQIELPQMPTDCTHNGHIFYLKTRDLDERTALLAHLKAHEIMAVFHYVPLHSAPAGQKFGRFHGQDRYTTAESKRLIRLPLFYGLSRVQIELVVAAIQNFYAA